MNSIKARFASDAFDGSRSEVEAYFGILQVKVRYGVERYVPDMSTPEPEVAGIDPH